MRRAGPALRAELLHVLTLPDLERVDRIGEFSANPKTRTFAESLIDCEEDKYVPAWSGDAAGESGSRSQRPGA